MKIRVILITLVFVSNFACAPSSRFGSNTGKTFTGTGGEITGVASYYGPGFHGKKTASGEVFDMYKMTCAHRTLPFGTVLLVTNIENKKSVKVRVNDRGPFIKGVIIDLSLGAAKKIGLSKGKVVIKILSRGE